MSNYYRVKKYRALKRGRSVSESRSTCEDYRAATNIYNNEININNTVINNNNEEVIISNEEIIINNEEEREMSTDSDGEFASFQDTQKYKRGINDKILQWALKNLDTLRLNVITELLLLLREEGHISLPKSLLGTKHHRIVQVMNSNRATDGTYTYLGIKNGLDKVISPNVYCENYISVFTHIDANI